MPENSSTSQLGESRASSYSDKADAIAIIGFAMRFPANIKDEEGMWEALIKRKSFIRTVPEERWPTDVFQHPNRSEPGRSVTFAAGILDEAHLFDAAFFNISPREAAWMDPQQRLLLQMTQETLDNAGLTDKQYRGSQCGVYIGISGMDYGQNAIIDLSSLGPHSMTGNTLSIAANRISYLFDLHGPSLAIDTACSSSVAAVHQACLAINSGAIPMALAGGINMLMHPYSFIGFSQASMLSATGSCRPFDACGDGYVRGEGGALLLLKPLQAALRDGDRIHAVIIGSGVNSDGAGKKGLTIPSSKAQMELMSSVLNQSGLQGDDLAYVEAHGTGTPVGDPAEAESIGAAYGKGRSRPLPISSAKANFGHLEPASGMAGLIKAILALKHRHIPPMPFDFQPNSQINFKDLNIYCAAKGAPLECAPGKALIGAVNSFGFGGLNAHILLRASLPEERPEQNYPASKGLPPLILSAKSQESLTELASKYTELLAKLAPSDYGALAWNAAFHRSWMEKRLAVFSDNPTDWIEGLRAYSEGLNSKFVTTESALAKPGKLAFVYTGNGAQWHGMGRQLYQEDPTFARVIDYLDGKMAEVCGWSILDALFNRPAEDFQDTTLSQPLLFAIQAALTMLFAELGIAPDATCGHSVGEVAAAWAAGALSLEDAIKVIHARSAAQGKTRGMGRMAAAGLSSEAAEKELQRLHLEDKIEIAAANSPHNCTLSGDEEALETLGRVLEEKNIFFRMLDLDYAFHSRHMDKVKAYMEELLRDFAPQAQQKAVFVSTATSKNLEIIKDLDAAYWWENMRNPVNFRAAISTLTEMGINIFVELGPHAILQRYIRENLPASSSARVLPSLQQSNGGIERIRSTAAAIYLLAPQSTLSKIFPTQAPWMPLPSYPWNLKKFNFPTTVERAPVPNRVSPLLGWKLPGAHPIWENALDPLKDSWLVDHKVQESIVFPAAGYVEIALEAAAQWQEGKALTLENFDILLPLLFENNKGQSLRCEINANDGFFTIQSRPRLEDVPWLTHAKGRIATHSQAISEFRLTPLDGEKRIISKEELYDLTTRLGLEYGPFFRRIISLSVAGDKIEAVLNDSEETAYILNPGALDACFHSLAAIYAGGERLEAYLPVGFTELKLFSQDPVKYVRGQVLKVSKRTLHARFELRDKNGHLVAAINGCRFRSLPSATKNPAIDNWHYRQLLKPLINNKLSRLPNPQISAEKLLEKYEAKPERILWYQEILPRLEASVMAWAVELNNKYDELLQERIPVALADWVKDLATFSESMPSEEMPSWQDIWLEAHNLAPQFLPALLPAARLMKHLEELGAGKEGFQELALERNNIARENSASNPAYAGIDQLLEKFLGILVEARLPHIIIDAGAYCDYISPKLQDLIESGQSRFTFLLPETGAPQFHNGEAQVEISADPLGYMEEQNATDSQDLIILRQLLHKSPDLKKSVGALFQSLRPGGIVLITERYPDWSADLGAAMSEDWWRRDQNAKVLPPRMKPESWLALLKDSGFEDCGVIHEPEAGELAAGSFLLYARKTASNISASYTTPPEGTFLILHDKGGEELAQKLAEKLQSLKQAVKISSFEDQASEEAQNKIFIYGDNVDPEKTPEVLAKLNARLLKGNPNNKTWIASLGSTHGDVSAQEKNAIFHGALSGFLRVWRAEKAEPGLRLRELSSDLDLEIAADLLLSEIMEDSGEDEVSLSSSGRHIFSLRKGEQTSQRLEEKLRLDILQPGRLDNLKWLPVAETPLGAEEVEARVMAVGLNFRDIMLAMGLLPEEAVENGFAGPNLGLEFSGIVTKVGKNVQTFKEGDKVAGFAPACFASHVRMPSLSITHIPAEMDFAAAAAIPTIFITAWYALKYLGRLQKGEKLLIHGGAGGVGLAAVQIGRLLGAEIFVTAGTEEKRDYLRLLGADHILDSRSLDFADKIAAITNGHGVDVVLNSLAGEAMRRSLALLKPFGRFLELGKRDYVENTSIGLRPFKENISYFSIDVDQLLTARPELASSLFEEVMKLLGSGSLLPPPLRVFPAKQVEEAFRTMQQARHMGKVVVDMQSLPPLSKSATPVKKPDFVGTWLISGGLSGFGLETARHLAQNGAQVLVLASRRGANVPNAEKIRQELGAFGTQVILKACNVADKKESAELVEWINANFAPLIGVVHAAAVFDDRRLENLDLDSFHRSLDPKLLGAWNLHVSTRKLPLKYFILYSSISVALGNPGQGNYVAANAGLESLTFLRNSENLPSSCFAWGPIGDVGYLSRNEAVQKNLSMQLGKAPLSSKDAMAAFDLYAGVNGVHILANINWHRALEFATSIPVRLEDVFKHSANESEMPAATDLSASLLAMEEGEALATLQQLIVTETAKVLGMDSAMTPLDRSLQAMGLDSLMAMELALSLEQSTGMRLPPMILQDAPTIEQLSRRLWDRLAKSAPEHCAEEDLLTELARRHSEDLKAGDIQAMLNYLESDKS